jgi:transposase
VRTSTEHNQRLNLLGAVCVSPGQRRIKLHVQSHWHALGGEQVIAFLVRLLKHNAGPIVLLWDRHPIHRRRAVKHFLARHPRVHVYEFPIGAPELNPTEGVWTQVNEHTASSAPHDRHELHARVLAGITRTRRSPTRLWACIIGSLLPWKRKPSGH